MYVVVQFYPWFNFYFPLFQTHYHTLPKTKEKQTFKARVKLNHNIYLNHGLSEEEMEYALLLVT